jgi:hypothetical protein
MRLLKNSFSGVRVKVIYDIHRKMRFDIIDRFCGLHVLDYTTFPASIRGQHNFINMLSTSHPLPLRSRFYSVFPV